MDAVALETALAANWIARKDAIAAGLNGLTVDAMAKDGRIRRIRTAAGPLFYRPDVAFLVSALHAIKPNRHLCGPRRGTPRPALRGPRRPVPALPDGAWATRSAAAEALGIAPRTLRHRIRAGALRETIFGGRAVVHLPHVELPRAMVAGGTEQTV